MKLQRTAALLAAAALGMAGLVATSPAAQAAPLTVTDAQFRWGINNESNAKGNAPGTFNFFSAGKLADPKTGGKQLTNGGATWSNGNAAGWKAAAGNVRIEKLQAAGGYAAATYAGTSTTKTGAALTAGKFSDHQIVIGKGTGTLDPATNDADLTWDGDFTVIYYSGMTFFYVSDPHLELDNGTGTVKATLGGFKTAMDDPSVWQSIAPTEVTLATITGADVTAEGLIATPRYLGVTYTAPEGATPQTPAGQPNHGSFPTSFVNFQQQTGGGSYWYSSGGAGDPYKPTLPLEVRAAVKHLPNLGISAGNRTYGSAQVVTVAISSPGTGAPLTGKIILTGAGTQPQKLLDSQGKVTFTLPANLAPKKYKLTATYSGNDKLQGRTTNKEFSVLKANVGKPVLKVTKKPTSKKAGKATITVKGPGAVTGKATITLKKGGAKKVVTVTLKNGAAKANLPKLAKGTWKAAVVYAGSATHNKGTSATTSIKVK